MQTVEKMGNVNEYLGKAAKVCKNVQKCAKKFRNEKLPVIDGLKNK